MKYIYFIQCTTTGFVKIGKSTNPKSRLKSLQCGSPTKLKLIKKIEGGIYLESILHEYFKHLHRHGEWFKYDGELKRFLKDKPILIMDITAKIGKRIKKNRLKYLISLEQKRLYL